VHESVATALIKGACWTDDGWLVLVVFDPAVRLEEKPLKLCIWHPLDGTYGADATLLLSRVEDTQESEADEERRRRRPRGLTADEARVLEPFVGLHEDITYQVRCAPTTEDGETSIYVCLASRTNSGVLLYAHTFSRGKLKVDTSSRSLPPEDHEELLGKARARVRAFRSCATR
jgi:hypothetical protein